MLRRGVSNKSEFPQNRWGSFVELQMFKLRMMMMVVIVTLDTNRKSSTNSSTILMTIIFSMTITITELYNDYEREHATQGLRHVYSSKAACDFTIPKLETLQ